MHTLGSLNIAPPSCAQVVAGLVLFTLQTKWDVTSAGGVLYSLLLALLVASVVQMIFHAPWLHMAICAGARV